MASPALVVGMQDNEYTDAQVGDAGGLFKSLDPAPCGAVPVYLQCSSAPVYLIQCSSSSLPHPVLQFQSTSSSAAVPVPSSWSVLPVSSASVPVYLIQCSSSSLPHPVLQFQSTSSSPAVPVYLIQWCSSSSSLPHPLFQFQSPVYLSPVLQFQSTLSSASVPVYLIQFQSTSSSDALLISCRL